MSADLLKRGNHRRTITHYRTWTVNGRAMEIGKWVEFIDHAAFVIGTLGLSDKILVLSTPVMSREFVATLQLVDAEEFCELARDHTLAAARCQKDW